MAHVAGGLHALTACASFQGCMDKQQSLHVTSFIAPWQALKLPVQARPFGIGLI